MAGGKVERVQIAGIAAAVPEAVKTVEDLQKAFGEEQSRRISKSVGVARRHVSTGGICASDLCFVAAEKLLEETRWERSSIDLLVFVSVTPDYVAPATACTLQHRLKLSRGCAAFDVTHACSGYPYGLWIVAHLLSSGNARRGPASGRRYGSRIASPYDRATTPLFGDAGSATAGGVERVGQADVFRDGSDGGGARHLIVGGGFGIPPPPRRGRAPKEENIRSDEDLHERYRDLRLTIREVPLTDKILSSPVDPGRSGTPSSCTRPACS
jgi:3-oxoacyl-[acyl-carrier-protein] synthase-3